MTRIASVSTHPVSVPRPVPVWTAHEEIRAWSVILTEIRTDDGLVGYGLIHGAPMPRICEWVARFAEIVRGMDALAHETVWNRLFALTSPRPGLIESWAIEGRAGQMRPVPRGERTQAMAAIAGIDIALWDLKGKAAGLPVWRLLGGENRPLTTYATGGYYRPGAPNSVYAEEMARFLDLGYRAVKLKTGAGSAAAEAERVAAVRAAIGDGPDLMLDMNAPYDLPACIDFARRVERHGIFWLEEPLHWYLQPADFARLAAATAIPLAHGERELTRFTVRDFIVNGGIRYVQFDATRAAGFTEALRVAALAEQHGVIVAPHTAPEIHGHLVLALPRCGYGVESHGGPDTDPLAHGLFRSHPELRDGYLHIGAEPGFGLDPDWGFVERHRA
jgi:D-galactarolactone cycloisomerase